MSEVIGRLTVENLPLATELATLPDQVKGYGVVREKAAEAMRATQAQLLNRWRDRP
jgi:indolepyruvate ferredoxin oxidoreductase